LKKRAATRIIHLFSAQLFLRRYSLFSHPNFTPLFSLAILESMTLDISSKRLNNPPSSKA